PHIFFTYPATSQFPPLSLHDALPIFEDELGKPGFWDDQQRAAQVSAEHARLTRRLDRYRRLTQEYQDAQELLAMDGDMAAEIERSEEHTSELQSLAYLVCRLLLEKKK